MSTKLITAWNDGKLEEKIKLVIELRANQLNLPYHRTGWLVDNFAASFDKLGNIEVDYFLKSYTLSFLKIEESKRTKLFKHPILLEYIEPVMLEIADWLLEIDENLGNW